MAAAFFRFWTNSTIGSFSLLYTNMYGKPQLFAVIYAVISLLGGIFSNIFFAVLSDKLEPRFIKIKAYLGAAQCVGGALCFVAIYYPFISLSFASAFFALDFFLFEGYNPLIVSMITMTSPQGA